MDFIYFTFNYMYMWGGGMCMDDCTCLWSPGEAIGSLVLELHGEPI